VGFGIGLMSGGRTRGRRPDRMAEAHPELQEFVQGEKFSICKKLNKF
jgi:hypothetical protein